MCFDLDSQPPIPAIAGAAISHENLVLEAEDSNRFAAFAAYPDARTTAGIVILPDRRGLYQFYGEVALRFAERGYTSVAIDYFGRTAGSSSRDDSFDWEPHARQTTAEGIQHDVKAAIGYLRSSHHSAVRDIFTVGFCFGGRASWLAASSGYGISGAVGFYGHPGQHPLVPGEDPTQRAPRTTAPILALQAGDDVNIPPHVNDAYAQALEAAGVEHEVITYDGAPHSFFDKHHTEFSEASEDAWARTLDFIERHSRSGFLAAAAQS